jgi:hypothetical protein
MLFFDDYSFFGLCYSGPHVELFGVPKEKCPVLLCRFHDEWILF